MAPTAASSSMAYIKQCKPVLRGEVSKMAYLMHAYAILSDCTLVGVDDRPGDSNAVELEMPAELDRPDFVSLHYRTPSGSLMEVAVMRADNELLLHWAGHSRDDQAAPPPIHSTSVEVGKYFTDTDAGADAYQRDRLPELMAKFTAGLDIMFQAPSAPLGQKGSAGESRPPQLDPASPDPVQPPPQPLQPVRFHPEPSPLMDGVPMRGGSHVGPDDPLFAGLVHGRPDLRSSVNPPGARFDPIAPDGLPGSHPDDFAGPGQADGWHDLGPPPGRNMPGRRGGGGDPFGGFM